MEELETQNELTHEAPEIPKNEGGAPWRRMLNVKVTREILKEMSKVAKRRRVSLEELASGYVESAIADERLANIPDDDLTGAELPFKPVYEPQPTTNNRDKVDAAMAQRVLHLYYECEMPTVTIAERFSVSSTSIRRIIREYESSEHVQPSITSTRSSHAATAQNKRRRAAQQAFESGQEVEP